MSTMNATDLLHFGLRCLALPRVIGELRYEAPICMGHKVTFMSQCSVGAFTYMNDANVFTTCSIGRFCSLGYDILIGPGQHKMGSLSTHPFVDDDADVAGLRCFEEYRRIAGDWPERDEARHRRAERAHRTTIGNDVWIGSRVIIMSGLTIADGAVIGAGAIVTRDVEPYAVVVGAPARVVRKRFADDVIAALLQLRWWQYDLSSLRGRADYSDIPAVIELLHASDLPLLEPACHTLRSDHRGLRVVSD
jgi:acetyltransferase-like isoleucine patch superfamily enzyme